MGTSLHKHDDSTQPNEILAAERGVINFGKRSRLLSSKSSSRVLLLQGPVGPFFRQLQNVLNKSGFDAWRICFTAGDRLYSHRDKRIMFSNGLSEWQSWLEQFLAYSRIDCIVLFGCERPVHGIAIKVAKRRNIPIISLEEGYVRPGFITVEQTGNNRFSPLAGGMPPIDFETTTPDKKQVNFSKSFSKMCWFGFTYYCSNMLSNLKQRDTFHKSRSLVPEAFFWARNFTRKILYQGRNYRVIEKLLEFNDKNYFLIPLQVADDSQLREAGNGWTNEKLIIAAISSFASEAPKGIRLVFKVHPLERGHSRYNRLIKSLSSLNAVQDRVDVIDTGSLGLLVRHSVGMLTVNSTSGLSAIAHGIPLLVTGEAIYSKTDFAQFASNKEDIDKFWHNAVFPDRNECNRYLSWVRSNSLKAGDYYARDGIELAITSVIEKINSVLLKPIDFDVLRKQKFTKKERAILIEDSILTSKTVG